jgi:hypothetical protein
MLLTILSTTLWFLAGFFCLRKGTVPLTHPILWLNFLLIGFLIGLWYLFQLGANVFKSTIKALWGVEIQGG